MVTASNGASVFPTIQGLTIDASGKLYGLSAASVPMEPYSLVTINPQTGGVTTVGNNVPGPLAGFNLPTDGLLSPDGGRYYVEYNPPFAGTPSGIVSIDTATGIAGAFQPFQSRVIRCPLDQLQSA
jgi:hypothetical protein